MAKNDFIRTPDGNQRIVDVNLKVEKAFFLPDYTGITEDLNDNPNEPGALIYKDSGLEFYDGSTWQPVGSSLPSQTGQAGNFLTTDGTSASWGALASINIYNTDGILTGNRLVDAGTNVLILGSAPTSSVGEWTTVSINNSNGAFTGGFNVTALNQVSFSQFEEANINISPGAWNISNNSFGSGHNGNTGIYYSQVNGGGHLIGMMIYDDAYGIGTFYHSDYHVAGIASYGARWITDKGYVDNAISTAISGAGAVTAVSITTANGVSGSSSGGTTPALTFTLGAITPSSVNGVSSSTMAFVDPTSSIQTQINSKLNLSGGTLTGDIQQSASPVNGNSLINKSYADNLFTGLSWKQEVRVATTANITLSGTQTIDSVAAIAGDRVLVKDQTTGTQNGIYLVASGSWTRTTDADSSAEIGSATVLVRFGTVNKNTQWTCTNSTDPVIGTDAITFGAISGGGTYTNGTGLSLASNVFSIDATYTATSGRTGYLSSTDWSIFNNKQSTLTFDSTPTSSSTNPVTSGGVFTALATKQATGNYITALTGDGTASGPGSAAITLATVNSNVGSFTNASITVNAKGLITAASSGSAGFTNPMTTLGDIIYGGAAGAGTRLAGNTATTNLFLTSQGSAGVATAPSYFDLFNTANTWSTAQTLTVTGVGTTQTNRLILKTVDTATSGNQKVSAALEFQGNGFETTGSANETVGMRISFLPVQGTTTNTGNLNFDRNIGGVYATNIIQFSTNGDISGNGVGTFSSGLKYGGAFNAFGSNIYAQSNSYIHSSTAAYLWGGAADVGYRTVFGGNASGANAIGNNFSNVLFANELGIAAASSGTHAYGANVTITGPTITLSGTGTVTVGSALHIDGPSVNATNNYAIFVRTGNSYFANGNLTLATAGNKIFIATGSNASAGTATLASGTVTISTTAVSASSLIFVVYNTPSGTLAAGLSVPVGSITAGTSFVINSVTTAGVVNTLDNSTIRWWFIN